MNDRHPRRRDVMQGLCALALNGLPALARAQPADAFPQKPLRIVVPFAAGGPTDLMARVVGRAIEQESRQSVVVENKPGGGGVIGMSDIVRLPADGYNMVMPSILAVTNPALMRDYPFDTVRTFSGVSVVGYVPHVLVVADSFHVDTLAGLVAAAKEKPGALSYGSTGVGTSAHLEAAMFADRAGISVIHVPYRGAAPALQDLLGGAIKFVFLDVSTALPYIRQGRLRALGVATGKRAPVLPDVPTVAEQGYPGFHVEGWYGLLVRSGTPRPVVERLYELVRNALAKPEVLEVFRAQGITPGGMPPAAFDAVIKQDLASWKETVTRLKITLE